VARDFDSDGPIRFPEKNEFPEIFIRTSSPA
jgi:hypothetical protein